MWFVLSVSGFAFTTLLLPLLRRLLSRKELEKNYRGEWIPGKMGLVFTLAAFPIVTLAVLIDRDGRAPHPVWITLILAFALLGVVDDFLGDHRQRGFGGHFRALKSGQLTSGVVKALWGGAAAAFLSIFASTTYGDFLINTAIIALSANLVNLLDVRPGRAGKAFLFLGIPLGVFSGDTGIWPLIGSVIAYLPYDLRAQTMMGDVGANVLGASIGFLIVQFSGVTRLVALIIFLGIQVFCERYSLSQIIEGNRFLSLLDGFGRQDI